MIYRCDNCNSDVTYKAGAKYCPMCGGALKRVNLENRIAEMYNAGNTEKQIAANLRITDILVSRTLARAVADGKVATDGLVQTEYEEKINNVMNTDWDGKLKTVKSAVPEATYLTINYYATKRHKEDVVRRVEKATEMVNNGEAIDKIADETKLSPFSVEKIMVQEIGKDKAVADPYIDSSYEDQILEIINSGDWDNRLSTIKNAIPEATYTCITSVVAKNR